jgi:hypothetical protein
MIDSKDFPIQDAVDFQIACERADSDALIGVMINGKLYPITRVTVDGSGMLPTVIAHADLDLTLEAANERVRQSINAFGEDETVRALAKESING